LSILKRIEDIVLAAESKLRNLNEEVANPSDVPTHEEQAAPNESSAGPEGELRLELELVEC
jgi:hypothetical protein